MAKTFFLTALLVISAMVTWQKMGSESPPAWIGGALKFGWIVPCGIALVIGFKPLLAGMLSPVYAVTKG